MLFARNVKVKEELELNSNCNSKRTVSRFNTNSHDAQQYLNFALPVKHFDQSEEWALAIGTLLLALKFKLNY